MNPAKRRKLSRKGIKRLLIALIVLYPLAGAFLGLDLGDTGYHLYAYTHLLSHPDKINYTTYFSTVIGFLWNQIFGGLGLIAFNLLEVFLEWGLVFLVYRTLRRELGELTVLAGSLFAVICADTYLNIFNYHQWNAFLLTAILCLEYKAMTEGKMKCSFWAGVLYILLVFSRVGSVSAAVTLGLYIYYGAMYCRSLKEAGKQILSFGLGAGAGGLAGILALLGTGKLDDFIANIFRLGEIASDNSTSYGFRNLLKSLIGDNLKVIASGILFYGALGLIICGLHILAAKWETRMKKFVCILLGAFVTGVGLYQMYFSYGVNPAENWPQMTTGPRFLLGVLYVTAFLCFLAHAFKKDEHSGRMTILVISSCMLIILTTAGSNTGTKHATMAMWLMAPVCIDTVKRMACSRKIKELLGKLLERAGLPFHSLAFKGAVALAFVMFFLKFGHMVYYTFNYDCTDRTKLTAVVENRKVRGILTTRREADAINGVLNILEDYEEEQPLMVFGNSLLFYYMTEREAYGKPWVTQLSYSSESFGDDLEKAGKEYEDTFPLVLYCRTNYADGFEEERLLQNQQSITANLFSGKKQRFLEFLKEHDYGIQYMNDYYAVMIPNLTKDTKGMENIIFGW